MSSLSCVYWALPHELRAGHLSLLLDVLDPAERSRAEELVRSSDRDAFVVAHAMLRLALSAYGDLPPAAWRFALTPSGKPELAAPLRRYGLRFSLSHARSIVACVVSRTGPVGVDVEEIASAPPEGALIAECCARSERLLLDRTAVAMLPQTFARLWTMKEAVVKALGAGPELPPRDVECALDPPRLLHLPGAERAAASWRIGSTMPTAHHVLALAEPAAGEPQSAFALRRLRVASIADLLAEGLAPPYAELPAAEASEPALA